MATLIKKHLVRPYLKDGENWVQIKKATEFVRNMNPTTEERDYISDEMPTTEVIQYKPSESFSITTYKGEADFDLFYKLYKDRAIGDDAKREMLIVSVFETGTTVDDTICYFAEKSNATITVTEFNASSSTISIDVNENGTPIKGYVTFDETTGQPTFTAGDMPA